MGSCGEAAEGPDALGREGAASLAACRRTGWVPEPEDAEGRAAESGRYIGSDASHAVTRRRRLATDPGRLTPRGAVGASRGTAGTWGSVHQDPTNAEIPLSDANLDLWVLVPLASGAAAAAERLVPPYACPEGYEHDAPHSAFENLMLLRAMEEAKAGRAMLPLGPPDWMPGWAV